MDPYRIGNILLWVSIGALLLRAIIRLILVFTYVKRNGRRVLTDEQRKKIRRLLLPVSILAILTAVASLILISV